jgi:hypothetical protein
MVGDRIETGIIYSFRKIRFSEKKLDLRKEKLDFREKKLDFEKRKRYHVRKRWWNKHTLRADRGVDVGANEGEGSGLLF